MSQQPQLSEDGKSYWNGQAWVPLPPKRRSVQNGPLGACCLIFALIFVGAMALAGLGALGVTLR